MTDELRLRARMIGAGLWLSALLLGSTGLWIAVSWQRPHRGGLLAMVAGAALVTVIVSLVPRERIVFDRRREWFFLTWSLSLIVFITVAAGLDAGVRSPIVLMLFLTLVYAALSYPRWSMSIVAATSLLAVLVLSQVHSRAGGPTNATYLGGLMLTLAITGVMCILQTRLHEQARTELGRVSRSDPLTGALNRRGFTERLTAELARAARERDSVALVVLDFDGFKQINDRDGHAAGDELLCWAVLTLGQALRPGDALGRLGGDEFAVLLSGSTRREAEEIADRLCLALSLRVSACTGTAATDADGTDLEQLHRFSDQRLYRAKRARSTGAPAADAVA